MTTMQQREVGERLEKHSQLFDLVEKVAQRHTDLLLQVTQSYFELLQQVSQQKRAIALQGKLINQCMERIMQLEGRSILGKFNQRLEQLEADKGSYYAINEQQFPKMLESLVKRVDAIENWLYTHEYNYFKEEEKQQGIADNAQLEETGTHSPDCRCVWCDPLMDEPGAIEP